MIVKNESAVICRCLDSVKSLIDYWVIVDTGSSDATKELIVNSLKNIPGELYERPWVNFSHNRNEALEYAKGKGDYLLFIDADDLLEYSSSFQMPELTKDMYVAWQRDLHGPCEVDSQVIALINNGLSWKWEGAIHESLSCSQTPSVALLEGVINRYGADGYRSSDPSKVFWLIEELEKELVRNPSDAKSLFYLAENYRATGQFEKAIETYQKRVSLGGFAEEVFWSLYCIAKCSALFGVANDTVLALYEKAYRYRPSRMEPIYEMILLYRAQGQIEKAYQLAKSFLQTPIPRDILFVSRWIYERGIAEQYEKCFSCVKKASC